MQLILTTDTSVAVSALQTRLKTELQAGKQVLWLVSGGSNIDASVLVMAQIPQELQGNLKLMLSDERYGPVGHADSNYQQFLDKSFASGRSTFIPTLQAGLSLEETAAAYAEITRDEFSKADVIISQLGIGADGHIAGALPGSPATTSEAWVVGYQSSPFQRVTMTFPALTRIHADYSLVFGADKRPALERLQTNDLPLTEQPAQILKSLPETYIYNDQLGDIV